MCVSSQFRWFTEDILHEMDNNVRLDQDYISVSETRVEASSEMKMLQERIEKVTAVFPLLTIIAIDRQWISVSDRAAENNMR